MTLKITHKNNDKGNFIITTVYGLNSRGKRPLFGMN